MFVSIDWLSFTVEMEVSQLQMAFSIWERVGEQMHKQFPLAKRAFVDGYSWTPRMGRAPYNAASQRDDRGVMAFAHQRISNALFEVGGIGMDALGSLEAEIAVASEVKSRLSRIDIAVDIFTETRPDEFAKQRNNEKFRSWSETVSESGHTIYVGSKTSDRYARVYRYNAPHPRSDFLRVEHVLKAEQAKLAVESIEENGLEAFVAMLGNTFGWSHADWSPSEDTDEAVAAWRPERRQGKTVAWIFGTVIPAMAKLHKDGAMDWDAFRAELHNLGVDI
jgi:hypothetical protein